MLPEETYKIVYKSLETATDAMGAHGNSELLKDGEDGVIYKRLLQLTIRVTKQGKKAQKLKANHQAGQP